MSVSFLSAFGDLRKFDDDRQYRSLHPERMKERADGLESLRN